MRWRKRLLAARGRARSPRSWCRRGRCRCGNRISRGICIRALWPERRLAQGWCATPPGLPRPPRGRGCADERNAARRQGNGLPAAGAARQPSRCEALAPGARLRVLATDKAAIGDFQAFCRETGHALLAWSEDGGVLSLPHPQEGVNAAPSASRSVALITHPGLPRSRHGNVASGMPRPAAPRAAPRWRARRFCRCCARSRRRRRRSNSRASIRSIMSARSSPSARSRAIRSRWTPTPS